MLIKSRWLRYLKMKTIISFGRFSIISERKFNTLDWTEELFNHHLGLPHFFGVRDIRRTLLFRTKQILSFSENIPGKSGSIIDSSNFKTFHPIIRTTKWSTRFKIILKIKKYNYCNWFSNLCGISLIVDFHAPTTPKRIQEFLKIIDYATRDFMFCLSVKGIDSSLVTHDQIFECSLEFSPAAWFPFIVGHRNLIYFRCYMVSFLRLFQHFANSLNIPTLIPIRELIEVNGGDLSFLLPERNILLYSDYFNSTQLSCWEIENGFKLSFE